MTFNSVGFLSLDKARSIVRQFNERIALSGYLLAPTGPCPPPDRSEGFVQNYTFDVDDLVSEMNNQVIIHHGIVPHRIPSRLHLLYRSSPIIYAHHALGPIDLSVEQIRDIIEGRVNDWGVLGQSNKPIMPLCHTGAVHNAVFRTIAKQSFKALRVRADLRGFDSYANLAERGSELAGSLVFGLRPEFALNTMLRPISISGKWPGLPLNSNEYPALQVWLSLPDHCPLRALTRYLDRVAGRMEKDVSALQKLAGRTRDYRRWGQWAPPAYRTKPPTNSTTRPAWATTLGQ